MNVRFTQIVDFWAGVPLCALLSAVNLALAPLRSKSTSQPDKILFIELSEMGSAFLAYAALQKTVSRVGSAEGVYFLIFKSNAQSVELLNLLPTENILTIDDSSFLNFIMSTFKTLRNLRRLEIEAVIDLELFSRFTTILSFLSGARLRAGFSNYTEEGLYRGNLLTHPVWYNPFAHISQNFIHLSDIFFSEKLEKPWPKQKLVPLPMGGIPQFSFASARRSRLFKRIEVLSSKKSKSRRIILLNPDPGQLPLRGWSIESYASVVNTLEKQHSDLCFVICGMASSQSYAERLQELVQVECFVNFCGETKDLYDVTELIGCSSLFLTTDSGPGHLASLTTTPSIVLFGPESPHRYRPLGENIRTLSAGLACSPCYTAANHRHSSCANNVCMLSISAEEVLQVAHDILG